MNMTESLLQKVEEKMMMLFSELEEARKEIMRLSQENHLLISEKERNTKKLQELLLLLDASNVTDSIVMNATQLKPVLIQG